MDGWDKFYECVDRETGRQMAEYLERFRESLTWWLHGELNWPSPDWEQQLQLFVAHTRYYGLEIHPVSIQSLHDVVEARINGTGPFEVLGQYRWDEPAVATGEPIQLALTVGVDDSASADVKLAETKPATTPIRPTQADISERFFNQKLELAKRHLAQIGPLLEALGQKLDATTSEPNVEIDDSELDAIETLIWQYNDALESARKAWLEDDLSGDAYGRMTEMETPATFNLPLFTDAQQAEWAKRQEIEIGKRLGERIATLDRIIFAMQVMEKAGTVASLALGAGVVLSAVRTGAIWTIVKTVAKVGASGAAAYGVGKGVEHGLRAAGASEETIHGVQLAAEIATWLLLLRRVRSAGARPATPTELPAKPGATSLNPNSLPKPSRKLPLRPKGRLLRPEDARRKVGQAFNQARKPAYPYNEVPIAKPHGGKPYILDSYDPIKGEIVFRRHTQFSEIQFKTAQVYFREFVRKYPPGSLIPDVPTAQGLAGTKLKGKMIFEVPPQWKPVPSAILREAARYEIVIRDSNGRIYHAD